MKFFLLSRAPEATQDAPCRVEAHRKKLMNSYSLILAIA